LTRQKEKGKSEFSRKKAFARQKEKGKRKKWVPISNYNVPDNLVSFYFILFT
jgi:hypothetical protein